MTIRNIFAKIRFHEQRDITSDKKAVRNTLFLLFILVLEIFTYLNVCIYALQAKMETKKQKEENDILRVKKSATVITKMQILSLNFLIYTLGGVWRPNEWTSYGAKLLYNIFSLSTIISMYFLVLTQFLDIILIVDNLNDFVNNSLMFVTIVAVCCKATVAVIRRNEIINLVEMLLKDPCKPRDKCEVVIQKKHDDFIRSWSIKYSLLATSSITSLTTRSVLHVMQGYLPYRVWLPYDYNIPLIFWITSIQQIITLILATIINVGTETLVFGLFLQTCAQLEIFENRLRKLVLNKADQYRQYSASVSLKGEKILSEYIRHHLKIYKYAKMLNSTFNEVLFCQFSGSILVLCTSVYYLAEHITESEATTLLVYTICMFVQIYVYCWSGNEVILKSTSIEDAIYKNWPLLLVSKKKYLLIIVILHYKVCVRERYFIRFMLLMLLIFII